MFVETYKNMIEKIFYWLENSKTVSDIITGLWSSGIFLLILTLLKPRLKICDNLCYRYDTIRKKHVTYFKIINKSIFFKVYDVQVRAWSTKIIPSTNGDNVSYTPININKDYQWVIYRLKVAHILQDFLMGNKRLDGRTDYAAQFSTFDNVRDLIKQGSSITIEVIAKHSLTGFTRVRIKTFKHINDLKKGEFYSGNSSKVQ